MGLKISCKCQKLPMSVVFGILDPLHTIKTFSTSFPTRLPTAFPTRISHQIFPLEFPTRISCKIFLQEFPARISCKIFPQEFPAKFSCKIFPQGFPARFPWLDPDWLPPHHPIPNAKFPAITALLNRPTYHKRSKVSPPPFPQIL